MKREKIIWKVMSGGIICKCCGQQEAEYFQEIEINIRTLASVGLCRVCSVLTEAEIVKRILK